MSQSNRRNFVKGILASLGTVPLCSKVLMADDSKKEDCEGRIRKIRHEMMLDEMKERALLFRKITEKSGSGVLDVVSTYIKENAKNRMIKRDIKERNLDAVISNLWDYIGEIIEFTQVKKTDTYLEYKVTKCIFADEMLKYNAGDIGYAFYCDYDFGFCEGLNPKIKFTRTKTLMEGHEICNHTYELLKS